MNPIGTPDPLVASGTWLTTSQSDYLTKCRSRVLTLLSSWKLFQQTEPCSFRPDPDLGRQGAVPSKAVAYPVNSELFKEALLSSYTMTKSVGTASLYDVKLLGKPKLVA